MKTEVLLTVYLTPFALVATLLIRYAIALCYAILGGGQDHPLPPKKN